MKIIITVQPATKKTSKIYRFRVNPSDNSNRTFFNDSETIFLIDGRQQMCLSYRDRNQCNYELDGKDLNKWILGKKLNEYEPYHPTKLISRRTRSKNNSFFRKIKLNNISKKQQ